MLTAFQKKVYNAVKGIPRGKVATYSDIAYHIGNPRAARAVGNALNKNPFINVPCHRVIRSDGFVGGYARGTKNKTEKLEEEGVEINFGFINLDLFGISL